MKPDILTLTGIIFITSVFVSGMGITENIDERSENKPPPPLHQGVVFEQRSTNLTAASEASSTN